MKAIIYFTLTGSTLTELKKKYQGDFYRIESKHRLPKRLFFQLFYLGFLTSLSIPVKFKPMEIDFDKYDEIILGSPVWAFKLTPFMKQFLKHNKFKNKKVTLFLTCGGNPGTALDIYKKYLDSSNEIVEEIVLKLDNVGKKKTG